MSASSSSSPTALRRELIFSESQPLFVDLLSDFNPQPTPSSSPIEMHRIPSTFLTDTLPSTSYTTPLTDHSYKVEPLSAVAIFVLLYFYPEDCLIGIYETGELELQPYGWSKEGFDSFRKRNQYNQNGNQNAFLLEPIKEACEIYGAEGAYIGVFFLFAYLGAEKLKGYYLGKKKCAQAIALEPIVLALFEHLRQCHATTPLTPFLATRFSFLTLQSLPTPSPPSTPTSTGQSPPTSGLYPALKTLTLPLWETGQQQIFTKNIIALMNTDAALDRERRISTITEMMTMITHFNGIYHRMLYRR